MKSLLRPLRQALVLAAALGCVAPALAQPRKVDQENLYHYWILLNTSVTMTAPNSGLNLETPGCAAVTYTIGSDGVPRDVTVAKLVPKSDLAMVARSAVSQFRYGPSLSNRLGHPISTYYVVPFNAPADAAQRKQLLQSCELPGYGT
ncbi:MAG: energy transducer TonB [Rhodanobacter sp.]